MWRNHTHRLYPTVSSFEAHSRYRRDDLSRLLACMSWEVSSSESRGPTRDIPQLTPDLVLCTDVLFAVCSTESITRSRFLECHGKVYLGGDVVYTHTLLNRTSTLLRAKCRLVSVQKKIPEGRGRGSDYMRTTLPGNGDDQSLRDSPGNGIR